MQIRRTILVNETDCVTWYAMLGYSTYLPSQLIPLKSTYDITRRIVDWTVFFCPIFKPFLRITTRQYVLYPFETFHSASTNLLVYYSGTSRTL